MEPRMRKCPWCLGMIDFYGFDVHADWHRAHDLHAAECDVTKANVKTSPFPFAFLPAMACTCGLTEGKGKDG